MGRAEELFGRVKHGGAAEIQQMIQLQEVEELFLDYKRAATLDPFKKLDYSDRKNLSRAVAGFANSEGGVIIWGVDCRQNPPNGDVPTGAIPISNPTAFRSLLEGALSGVTLPPHSGVENVALEIAGSSEGFVATYVPIGLNVPYRTLVEKEEYLIRSGSNFSPTPHAVLAGLFGRIQHPNLNIHLRLENVSGRTKPNRVLTLVASVFISNQGRGLAQDIYFSIEPRLPANGSITYNFLDTQGYWDHWKQTFSGGDRVTAVSKNYPSLPPGSRNFLLRLTIELAHPFENELCLDLISGAGNGIGTFERISCDRSLIEDAVTHFTLERSDSRLKEMAEFGDQELTAKLKSRLERPRR